MKVRFLEFCNFVQLLNAIYHTLNLRTNTFHQSLPRINKNKLEIEKNKIVLLFQQLPHIILCFGYV